MKRLTYGVRKTSLAAPEKVAEGLRTGDATAVVCSSCSADCIAHTPMLARACAMAGQLDMPLEILCFECSIASGAVSRGEISALGGVGGMVVQLEPPKGPEQ